MSKSWLIKALLLGVITLVMVIILAQIYAVAQDREHYRRAAQQQIEATWSGSQYVMGPVLQIPYQVKTTTRHWDEKLKQYRQREKLSWYTYHELAESVQITSDLQTERRQLGIHELPVFTNNIVIEGWFSIDTIQPDLEDNQELVQLGKPLLQLMVRDVRGLDNVSTATWQGQSLSFKPGSQFDDLPGGMHAVLSEQILKYRGDQSFSIQFDLRGSRQLDLLLSGKNTRASMHSNWPHPGFSGRYAPLKRDISAAGFTAEWAVSSLAGNTRGLFEECLKGRCEEWLQSGFTVRLVNPVDLQQMLSRALKYGILFIALTYISFFLFEVISAQPLHPIQYALVGSALSVFYLLLTALAEHLLFGLSYALAAIACSGLLGIYLQAILPEKWHAWLYSVSLLLLYSLLYVILRSEDSALLMGALLVFVALTAVMLLTRRIDWYVLEAALGTGGKPERVK